MTAVSTCSTASPCDFRTQPVREAVREGSRPLKSPAEQKVSRCCQRYRWEDQQCIMPSSSHPLCTSSAGAIFLLLHSKAFHFAAVNASIQLPAATSGFRQLERKRRATTDAWANLLLIEGCLAGVELIEKHGR